MTSNVGEKSPFANMLQVGVVVKDIEKAMERLTKLGIGPWYSKQPPKDAKSIYRGQPFNANGRVIIMAAMMGNMELELIQPVKGGAGSPHKDYLEEKGEGIQHLCFRVDNLDNEVQKLLDLGSTALLDGRRGDGAGVAYLDLNVGGIIVELVGRKPLT